MLPSHPPCQARNSSTWKERSVNFDGGSMLKDAGFASVETHRLEHDIMNLYFICR